MKTRNKISIGKYIWVLLFFLGAAEIFAIFELEPSYGVSDIQNSILKWSDILATAILSISLLLPKEKRFLFFDIAGCAAKTVLTVYKTGLLLDRYIRDGDTTTVYFLSVYYVIPIVLFVLLPLYKWGVIKNDWGCTIAKIGVGVYLQNVVLMVPQLWGIDSDSRELSTNLYLKPLLLSAVYSLVVGCLQAERKQNKKGEKLAEQTSGAEKEAGTAEETLARSLAENTESRQPAAVSSCQVQPPQSRGMANQTEEPEKQRKDAERMEGMKYCSHCGQQIREEAVICPHCGCQVGASVDDTPNTGLNIIAFLLPVIGAIMYFVYHEKEPQKAAAIGKWAIYGVIFTVVCYVLLTACGAMTVSRYL